jgi:hypothetical protein
MKTHLRDPFCPRIFLAGAAKRLHQISTERHHGSSGLLISLRCYPLPDLIYIDWICGASGPGAGMGDADLFWAPEFTLHEFIESCGRGGFGKRGLIVPLK